MSNYELLWPTELFVSEGKRVLRSQGASWTDRAIWFLTETLAGTTAVADFEDIPKRRELVDDSWSAAPGGWGTQQTGPTQSEWLGEVICRAAELRHAAEPRPYWPQRHGQGLSLDGSTARDTRRDFARIIGEFAENGYLAEVFGEECVDDPDDLPDASEVIDRRLGIAHLWPLAPEFWDEDTFYGLIEVFHDLVSRPRMRRYHSYGGCGWHHSEFHNGPARTLYRWKINKLLRTAGIDYALAAEGEDLGRLVAVTDDARRSTAHSTTAHPTSLHVSATPSPCSGDATPPRRAKGQRSSPSRAFLRNAEP